MLCSQQSSVVTCTCVDMLTTVVWQVSPITADQHLLQIMKYSSLRYKFMYIWFITANKELLEPWNNTCVLAVLIHVGFQLLYMQLRIPFSRLHTLPVVSLSKLDTFLKVWGSHIITLIISITAVSWKSGITIGAIIWGHCTIVNTGSNWGDHDRLDHLCSIQAIGHRPGWSWTILWELLFHW